MQLKAAAREYFSFITSSFRALKLFRWSPVFHWHTFEIKMHETFFFFLYVKINVIFPHILCSREHTNDGSTQNPKIKTSFLVSKYKISFFFLRSYFLANYRMCMVKMFSIVFFLLLYLLVYYRNLWEVFLSLSSDYFVILLANLALLPEITMSDRLGSV